MDKKGTKVSLTLKVMLVIGLLFSFLVAGCIGNKDEQQVVQTTPTVTKSELKLNGATTVYPIALKASREFMKMHPEVNISVDQTNTGGGYQKLIAGEIDIAYATRWPKPAEEEAARNKGVSLHRTVIMYDAVVMITHPSNPITDISFQQLGDIYFNGTITDWSQLTNGAKKGKINIYNTNPQTLGTAAVFNTKVAGNENAKYVPGTTQFDLLTLMAPAIANDINGLGYNQIGGIPATVKILKVNGVYPSKTTILDSTYPMSRQVFLITNGPPSGIAKDFINYILSKDGQKIVEDEGFIALI